ACWETINTTVIYRNGSKAKRMFIGCGICTVLGLLFAGCMGYLQKDEGVILMIYTMEKQQLQKEGLNEQEIEQHLITEDINVEQFVLIKRLLRGALFVGVLLLLCCVGCLTCTQLTSKMKDIFHLCPNCHQEVGKYVHGVPSAEATTSTTVSQLDQISPPFKSPGSTV
ncbi:unnamed protein product, partial [Didymodactylos carnosus]